MYDKNVGSERLTTTNSITIYDIVKDYINNKIDMDDIINFYKNLNKAYKIKEDIEPKSPTNNNILSNTKKYIGALDNLFKLIDRNNNKDDTDKNIWVHDGVDITWMDDGDLFNEIANNLGNEFALGYDDELDAIKNFVQNINEGKINSLKTAAYIFKG